MPNLEFEMKYKLKIILMVIMLVMVNSCNKYNNLTNAILGTYQSTGVQVLIISLSTNTIAISYDHDQYYIHKATMSDSYNFTFDEVDTIATDAVHFIGGGQLLNNNLQLNMSVTDTFNSQLRVVIVNFNGVKIP